MIDNPELPLLPVLFCFFFCMKGSSEIESRAPGWGVGSCVRAVQKKEGGGVIAQESSRAIERRSRSRRRRKKTAFKLGALSGVSQTGPPPPPQRLDNANGILVLFVAPLHLSNGFVYLFLALALGGKTLE